MMDLFSSVPFTEKPKISDEDVLLTIDLFAGVGGVRLGFEKAGFKTCFANDFEENCANAYNLNCDDAKLTVADITKEVAVKVVGYEDASSGAKIYVIPYIKYANGAIIYGAAVTYTVA